MLSTAPLSISSRIPLTRERAANLLGSLEGYRLYVAANRAPVHHILSDGQPDAQPSAGGLVTALASVANYVPLTWIAAASGGGDRLIGEIGPRGRPLPGLPRIKYVAASETALSHSYHRFANPILWFLQHDMFDRLRASSLAGMDSGWITGYRPVNHAFAAAIEREMVGVARPIVLTQDYHLYLLPTLLRRRRSDVLIQHFTHIPWPAPDRWNSLLPSIRRELHVGLLGADVAGFQTQDSVNHFLRSCELFVPGARVDYSRDTVWLDGRQTRVRAYPISVDPAYLRRVATLPETAVYKRRLRPLLGERTIVRVDRMDPSKNIALGFRAFGLLLERRPELVGRIRFLAFLVPSREAIPEYQSYAQEVWAEVERVNARFAEGGRPPIEVFYEDNRHQAIAGMALADVLLVNPVADGMNLVAKEGPVVSERDAVLVLSKSCGAYRQLASGALSVEPTDPKTTASMLERALEMPQAERVRRLSVLRSALDAEDLAWWIRSQLTDLFNY